METDHNRKVYEEKEMIARFVRITKGRFEFDWICKSQDLLLNIQNIEAAETIFHE